MRKTRKIDPFFYDAINAPFLMPHKTAFVMPGPVGIGKSSNYVMLGGYKIAQCVEPIRKGSKWVRESKWGCLRESEESAVNTIMQMVRESIFTPEVMALPNPPARKSGKHPTKIIIEHSLPDNTWLEMVIECHGFNHENSDDRLRSHEFLGMLCFEAQGIPFKILEVARQRCGRYRTENLAIKRTIGGREYKLTGIVGTAIVLADINVPARPHPFYSEYYDVDDKDSLPYHFFDTPPALCYRPTAGMDNIPEGYPVTRYEGREVMWYPNKKIYHMSKHFEERDENGKNIAWSGFQYWYNMLHRSDSEIRRYILGLPDNVGGDAAIYKGFKRNNETVLKKEIDPTSSVFVGYDPGGHAAIEMFQKTKDGGIHVFKEFYFEPADHVSVRQHFNDFFIPYCERELVGHEIVIVPDPASSWLGKSIMMAQSENVLNIIRGCIEEVVNPKCHYRIDKCRVQNQDVTGRVNSLEYFIDKGLLTIDPLCTMLITGLIGGYSYKKTRAGEVSDTIDKGSKHSHPVEALQYPCVNLLFDIKKGKRNESRNKPVTRIRTNR